MRYPTLHPFSALECGMFALVGIGLVGLALMYCYPTLINLSQQPGVEIDLKPGQVAERIS